jgi:glycosyltransferase involved in cell wall biosynthesis
VIVLLHGAPAWGAVEEYVAAVAKALASGDEEVVLVHAGVEQFEHLGVRTIVFTPSSAPKDVVRLTRLVRRLRPRLAHVIDVWPPAQIAAWLARVPRVLVTHHTPELPRSDNAVGRVLLRAGWATRPEVIYTSEADRKRDGRLPSHVVPLGIDLARFSVERRPHEGVVIGNVARLVEQKGQRTLVEAAPLVLDQRPDARFIVVGDGELRDELEGLADGLPFEFRGLRDDVPAQLAEFDVFAFPSLFEGLCLAVIEAQAAGVPVIATPVGGITETVVDGGTGLLVPPRDAEALAAAILRLLDDGALASRLAREARARVRACYSIEQMVSGTLELYGSLQ